MFGGTGRDESPRGSEIGTPGVHLKGRIPVQAGDAYSESLSTAKPVRILADASTKGTARIIVAAISDGVGGRTVAQRPRTTYLTKSRMAVIVASGPSTTS